MAGVRSARVWGRLRGIDLHLRQKGRNNGTGRRFKYGFKEWAFRI